MEWPKGMNPDRGAPEQPAPLRLPAVVATVLGAVDRALQDLPLETAIDGVQADVQGALVLTLRLVVVGRRPGGGEHGDDPLP